MLPLVQEVLHAQFEHHAYPSHTDDSWTVMLVDQGTVTYDLDRHEHRTTNSTVTLLPPEVPTMVARRLLMFRSANACSTSNPNGCP